MMQFCDGVDLHSKLHWIIEAVTTNVWMGFKYVNKVYNQNQQIIVATTGDRWKGGSIECCIEDENMRMIRMWDDVSHGTKMQ